MEILADPLRRRIVAQIALGRGQPARIAKEVGRSRPAVSRQLRLLRREGLINVYRDYCDGRKRRYTVNPLRQGEITAWLAGTDVARRTPPEEPADWRAD